MIFEVDKYAEKLIAEGWEEDKAYDEAERILMDLIDHPEEAKEWNNIE